MEAVDPPTPPLIIKMPPPSPTDSPRSPIFSTTDLRRAAAAVALAGAPRTVDEMETVAKRALHHFTNSFPAALASHLRDDLGEMFENVSAVCASMGFGFQLAVHQVFWIPLTSPNTASQQSQ